MPVDRHRVLRTVDSLTASQQAPGLELGIFSGAMPEVQNFNGSPVLVQTVVDVERGMKKPPEPWMSFYGSADVRKGLKQVDVVEKIVGKLFGCFGMLIPRPLENLFQIG